MYSGQKHHSVIHTSSVSSWRPRSMPGKTGIDSCVTLRPIVPQPQLSSYRCFSLLLFVPLVHSSTPLHLLRLMICDRLPIEMHLELHHYYFNQKHLPLPNNPILFANTRETIIKKKRRCWIPLSFLSSFSLFFFFTSYKYFLSLFSTLLSKSGLRGLVKGQLKHHTSLNFHYYSSTAEKNYTTPIKKKTPLKTCFVKPKIGNYLRNYPF